VIRDGNKIGTYFSILVGVVKDQLDFRIANLCLEKTSIFNNLFFLFLSRK